MASDTIQHSAELILRLYELRRDPELRAARQWFAREFRPSSAQDILSLILSGERASASYRMVTSYWEMAAAMVNRGAIDPELFRESNGEHVGFFSIIEPFLEEFRALTKETAYLVQWEKLVRDTPGAAERLESRRRLFSAWTTAPVPA
jgi:hypothetical protein